MPAAPLGAVALIRTVAMPETDDLPPASAWVTLHHTLLFILVLEALPCDWSVIKVLPGRAWPRFAAGRSSI
jgi:hypothetical protein